MISEISIIVWFCRENYFQTLFIDFHRQKVSKSLDGKIPDWCLGWENNHCLLNCCPKKLLKDVKLVPKLKTQPFSCSSTSFTLAILARKQNTVSQLLFPFSILSVYEWSVNNICIFQNQQSWITASEGKTLGSRSAKTWKKEGTLVGGALWKHMFYCRLPMAKIM